ncbi:hypothetical protein, partial [uncultured Lactobacillus sp.]|uniref:hypothetical protein n=1 Tax=uncultured Lactobacillus sp. TaxID=153152 RepID=UPI002625F90B
MEKLKAIQFNFENCESEKIPIDYIPYFRFVNVHSDLKHEWNYENEANDELETMFICDAFKMIADWDKVNTIETLEPFNLAERITEFCDLVDVNLIFKSGKIKNIYMPWEDNEYGESNILM